MLLLDPKFGENKAKYIAQCAVVTLVMIVVLEILDAIADAAVIGALGASTFIAFTMPHARVSSPRFLVGGYAVGILAGVVCYYASVVVVAAGIPVLEDSSHVFFAALAVGSAIFVMVITNLEHPPAAGVALGLVLNECHPLAILVVAVGIVLVAAMKTILKPILISLL